MNYLENSYTNIGDFSLAISLNLIWMKVLFGSLNLWTRRLAVFDWVCALSGVECRTTYLLKEFVSFRENHISMARSLTHPVEDRLLNLSKIGLFGP